MREVLLTRGEQDMRSSLQTQRSICLFNLSSGKLDATANLLNSQSGDLPRVPGGPPQRDMTKRRKMETQRPRRRLVAISRFAG